MDALLNNLVLVVAQATGPTGPAPQEEDSGSFLVQPGIGPMIWTILAFIITLLVLRKYAFPRIAEALDKRQKAIEEAIDVADKTRQEADELLTDYRARLTEARAQAEEIVARAQRAGEAHQRESFDKAKEQREELLEQTRKDVEAEARRAIQQIRNEVADLTVLATEKVARKTLDSDDQKRLVEEALSELDFDALSKASR